MKKPARQLSTLLYRVSICTGLSVIFAIAVIVSWIFLIPMFFSRFDGFSGQVLMRIKIVSSYNDSRFVANILDQSAIWDDYMINWVRWNTYSHDGRIFVGNLPSWVKMGDTVIVEGGRKQEEAYGYDTISILEAKRFYKNHFQPFGVDRSWLFFASILGSLFIPWLIIVKFQTLSVAR